MSEPLRLVQFFNLVAPNGPYLYQNYFVGETKVLRSLSYQFAPFEVKGSVHSLNGDNLQIQVLFPASAVALKAVDAAEGNRKSLLTLYTRTVNANGQFSADGPTEYFIGLGASISVDTVELRFNTAADSVASNFPAQRLNQENVGVLPLDSALSLR